LAAVAGYFLASRWIFSTSNTCSSLVAMSCTHPCPFVLQQGWCHARSNQGGLPLPAAMPALTPMSVEREEKQKRGR
jgi:hypothetical protein